MSGFAISGNFRDPQNEQITYMEKELKISIVTVCFNAASIIEQTISSVINQSYKNVEYIIIDGGSTDGTIDIIQKKQQYLTYWISEPDHGIYDAMNKGASAATGDYIFFLNAGDLFYDIDTLSQTVQIIALDENTTVYLGDIVCSFRNKVLGRVKATPFVTAWHTPPHQGMFIKRILFENDLYCCNFRILGDREFLLRVKHNKEGLVFKTLNIVISEYDLSGISSSRRKSFKIYREAKVLAKSFDDNFLLNSFLQCMKALLKYVSSYVLPDTLYFKMLYYRKQMK